MRNKYYGPTLCLLVPIYNSIEGIRFQIYSNQLICRSRIFFCVGGPKRRQLSLCGEGGIIWRSAFVRPFICDWVPCFHVGIESGADLFIVRPTKLVPVVPTGSPSPSLSYTLSFLKLGSQPRDL